MQHTLVSVAADESVQQMKCVMQSSLDDLNSKVDDLNSKLDKLCTLFVHLSEDMKIVKKMITKKNIENKNITDSLSYELSLPIKSIEEFHDVEKKVMEIGFRNFLITKLSTFGGNTLSNVVHFMMNGLLDRNLAVKFSLQGKTKEKFKSTNLFSCILGL